MISIGTLSITAGMVLLVIGIANTAIMFEVLGRKGAPGSFRSLHRILGWIFVLGVIGFIIYMFPRAAHLAKFNASQALHAALGTALVPLAVAKFLVSRRYKAYMGSFPEMGFIILAVTVVVIMLSVGHQIAAGVFEPHGGHEH